MSKKQVHNRLTEYRRQALSSFLEYHFVERRPKFMDFKAFQERFAMLYGFYVSQSNVYNALKHHKVIDGFRLKDLCDTVGEAYGSEQAEAVEAAAEKAWPGDYPTAAMQHAVPAKEPEPANQDIKTIVKFLSSKLNELTEGLKTFESPQA